MRAQDAAPLVVLRSEAAPGRVGLRLIGELDVNTVAVLEAELAGSREHSPPAVIDLSELRFLDLIGLRALMRAGSVDGLPVTRLVGAWGIVRRLIELSQGLDAPRPSSEDTAGDLVVGVMIVDAREGAADVGEGATGWKPSGVASAIDSGRAEAAVASTRRRSPLLCDLDGSGDCLPFDAKEAPEAAGPGAGPRPV